MTRSVMEFSRLRCCHRAFWREGSSATKGEIKSRPSFVISLELHSSTQPGSLKRSLIAGFSSPQSQKTYNEQKLTRFRGLEWLVSSYNYVSNRCIYIMYMYTIQNNLHRLWLNTANRLAVFLSCFSDTNIKTYIENEI